MVDEDACEGGVGGVAADSQGHGLVAGGGGVGSMVSRLGGVLGGRAQRLSCGVALWALMHGNTACDHSASNNSARHTHEFSVEQFSGPTCRIAFPATMVQDNACFFLASSFSVRHFASAVELPGPQTFAQILITAVVHKTAAKEQPGWWKLSSIVCRCLLSGHGGSQNAHISHAYTCAHTHIHTHTHTPLAIVGGWGPIRPTPFYFGLHASMSLIAHGDASIGKCVAQSHPNKTYK
eukprot:scaffold117969_cov19-Tisochrysis_lutea.AAC.2